MEMNAIIYDELKSKNLLYNSIKTTDRRYDVILKIVHLRNMSKKEYLLFYLYQSLNRVY